jgi:SSS family solute:Na+ symporter
LAWGILGTGVALAMMGQKSLLDAWWKLSGIFAGGMLGLFLLGLIARKADNASALTGVAIGVLVICWMTFDKAEWIPENLRSPFHANMITVIGTLTIFLVGILMSQLRRKN